jgi:CopG family nickel-responsive transcriptional regulator
MKDKIVRFGVSLPQNLITPFDDLIRQKEYPNRSEAIRDMIRQKLVQEEIEQDEAVVGVLHLLYDHHTRELTDHLTGVQHDHHDWIISATHVHLDHHNCLEVILMRGKASDIKRLSDRMLATKGVKHGQLYLTSTGKNIG